MNVSAFTAALRIARRDAWRNKGRSLLVLLLVGLPVLVLSVVDVGWRTYQLTTAQSLNRHIGAADVAVMSGQGGAVAQAPKGWLDGGGYSLGSTDLATPQTEATLIKALPAGSQVISMLTANAQLAIRTHAGLEYTRLIGLDYDNPIARGLVEQVSGRAPQNSSEVALTTELADETGVKVGARVSTFDGSRTLTVVGIVHDTTSRKDVAMYSVPAAVTATPAAPVFPVWLVRTVSPVRWSQVLSLNALGFVAVSRSVITHPPPASQVSFPLPVSGTSSTAAAATALVGGMALLEIVLLAGPSFAVTARRQRHALALIAAAGGRRRDMANVVLANGVVLGLSAGVAGVVGGAGIGTALLALFGDRINTYPGPLDIRPLELAGLALVSLVTALLAATLPAWSASRLDIIAALAGRRGQDRIRRRVPLAGVVILGVGVLVAAVGSAANRNVDVILAGVALTEVGLIMATPAVISSIAALGRGLPFAARLALRDAARNRSSAAPAVAAVMACMIGAVAICIVVTSQNDLSRREYHPRLPTNVAFAEIGPSQAGVPQPSPQTVASILSSTLDTHHVVNVYASDQPTCLSNPTPGTQCRSVNISVSGPANSTTSSTEILAASQRYDGGDFPPEITDDGTAVSALFGVAEPKAQAALRAGIAVVTDAQALHAGKVTLAIDGYSFIPSPLPGAAPSAAPPTQTHASVTIPAIAVTNGYPAALVILPPAVATRLAGYGPRLVGVLAVLAHRPTSTQRQEADGALATLQPGLKVQTEDGFQNSNSWLLYALLGAAGLIALGAAAVATALANLDGRADLLTLAAVGASPRTRRTISAARAGLIAGLGCVIGGAAGFVPAIAWIEHTTNSARADLTAIAQSHAIIAGPQLRLIVPWPDIALTVLGVPLCAVLLAAAAASVTRLPSEHSGQ